MNRIVKRQLLSKYIVYTLGVMIFGFGLGLLAWDTISVYIPLDLRLLGPIFLTGWFGTIMGYGLLLTVPAFRPFGVQPRVTGLVLILVLWIFTTLGATATFWVSPDYMSVSQIVFGSAYLAAVYNFGLIFLPLLVVYGLALIQRRPRHIL